MLLVPTLLTTSSPAAAQHILDWPLRTTAGPEALTRGAEAVFWNSASITGINGRGEVLIADQRTPDVIGISGFAAAGSWRLDARTTLGAGYQHVAIEDIDVTSSSPLPDELQPTLSIRDDRLTVGVSHALGYALRAGAGVQYNRWNETGSDSSTTSLSAGFLLQGHHSFHPAVAASIATHEGGARYNAGIEAGTMVQGLDVRGGYGIRGGGGVPVEHRIGITGSWRQLLAVSGGVATANAGAERSWEPVLGASLRVTRYELGVLRELLSNDFGAAYSFRFRIGLK